VSSEKDTLNFFIEIVDISEIWLKSEKNEDFLKKVGFLAENFKIILITIVEGQTSPFSLEFMQQMQLTEETTGTGPGVLSRPRDLSPWSSPTRPSLDVRTRFARVFSEKTRRNTSDGRVMDGERTQD